MRKTLAILGEVFGLFIISSYVLYHVSLITSVRGFVPLLFEQDRSETLDKALSVSIIHEKQDEDADTPQLWYFKNAFDYMNSKSTASLNVILPKGSRTQVYLPHLDDNKFCVMFNGVTPTNVKMHKLKEYVKVGGVNYEDIFKPEEYPHIEGFYLIEFPERNEGVSFRCYVDDRINRDSFTLRSLKIRYMDFGDRQLAMDSGYFPKYIQLGYDISNTKDFLLFGGQTLDNYDDDETRTIGIGDIVTANWEDITLLQQRDFILVSIGGMIGIGTSLFFELIRTIFTPMPSRNRIRKKMRESKHTKVMKDV